MILKQASYQHGPLISQLNCSKTENFVKFVNMAQVKLNIIPASLLQYTVDRSW